MHYRHLLLLVCFSALLPSCKDGSGWPGHKSSGPIDTRPAPEQRYVIESVYEVSQYYKVGDTLVKDEEAPYLMKLRFDVNDSVYAWTSYFKSNLIGPPDSAVLIHTFDENYSIDSILYQNDYYKAPRFKGKHKVLLKAIATDQIRAHAVGLPITDIKEPGKEYENVKEKGGITWTIKSSFLLRRSIDNWKVITHLFPMVPEKDGFIWTETVIRTDIAWSKMLELRQTLTLRLMGTAYQRILVMRRKM